MGNLTDKEIQNAVESMGYSLSLLIEVRFTNVSIFFSHN